ncbi:hypothetical protein TNCV_3909401 [Trichonephila clavipes]|nr:hypothetical protein TNCV_3909401 [Trichonephila clavipes]
MDVRKEKGASSATRLLTMGWFKITWGGWSWPPTHDQRVRVSNPDATEDPPLIEVEAIKFIKVQSLGSGLVQVPPSPDCASQSIALT